MVTFYKPTQNNNKHTKKHIKNSIVTGFDHKLRGVAKQADRTLFIYKALPGEELNADIIKTYPRFSEAVITKIVKSSEDRINPTCQHFDVCGGCALQMLPTNLQLKNKQKLVLEQLDSWANVTPALISPPLSGPEYGYRQKARLQVDVRDGQCKLGFVKLAKKSIFNVEQCPILNPSLEAMIPVLHAWLVKYQIACVAHIELVYSASGSAVIVRHTKPLEPSLRHALTLDQATVWFQYNKQGELTDNANKPVDPRLSYPLVDDEFQLHFHPKDFIQSNPYVNNAMVKQAIDWLVLNGSEKIVELFSGMGNFTLPLAKHAAQVTAVEVSHTMVERAQENAKLNSIANVNWQVADLDDELFSIDEQADIVVLDPPRSGAKKVVLSLLKILPERILYISCNSATFARDTNVLVENGYHLQRFNVMDMFPQTAHLEIMGLFGRSKRFKGTHG